jgi:hypothetical protein
MTAEYLNCKYFMLKNQNIYIQKILQNKNIIILI